MSQAEQAEIEGLVRGVASAEAGVGRERLVEMGARAIPFVLNALLQLDLGRAEERLRGRRLYELLLELDRFEGLPAWLVEDESGVRATARDRAILERCIDIWGR